MAEPLDIKKLAGQVDRDYNLHDAMTGDGQLEIADDTYRKLLVSFSKFNTGPEYLL